MEKIGYLDRLRHCVGYGSPLIPAVAARVRNEEGRFPLFWYGDGGEPPSMRLCRPAKARAGLLFQGRGFCEASACRSMSIGVKHVVKDWQRD